MIFIDYSWILSRICCRILFSGPARPERLLSYGGLPFLVFFDAVALQFVNWPSDKCGGGFC